MKIASWNVNGIRSSLKNGFEKWLDAQENDIICLQETKIDIKTSLALNLRFKKYDSHWGLGTKPGYSGVGILAKKNLPAYSVTIGIGDEEIDKEGRVISLEFDNFILLNCYFPHSHRKLLRLNFKIQFCEKIFSYINQLKQKTKKPIIIAGDINIAHEEIDLTNYKQNKNNAGFLEVERNWLTSLLDIGFIDAFRFFCKEPNHYTWWGTHSDLRKRNIGWRIDYFFVEKSLTINLKNCSHSPEVLGSDHCPITIILDP